jgi:hypothetical protein
MTSSPNNIEKALRAYKDTLSATISVTDMEESVKDSVIKYLIQISTWKSNLATRTRYENTFQDIMVGLRSHNLDPLPDQYRQSAVQNYKKLRVLARKQFISLLFRQSTVLIAILWLAFSILLAYALPVFQRNLHGACFKIPQLTTLMFWVPSLAWIFGGIVACFTIVIKDFYLFRRKSKYVNSIAFFLLFVSIVVFILASFWPLSSGLIYVKGGI